MREIIFDTETTGLESSTDRIIEIGGVELINHFPTGRTLHLFINPDGKTVHPDALAVHGISDDFLKDKPKFKDVANEVREFFEGARWVAHNANFDMGFINAEFARIGLEPIDNELVTDTLSLARRKNPMGPNSLDALCRRYGIDNSHRAKHGALLDAELLAEVYIEMIGGRQTALGFEAKQNTDSNTEQEVVDLTPLIRLKTLPSRLQEVTVETHENLVSSFGQHAIWNKYKQ